VQRHRLLGGHDALLEEALALQKAAGEVDPVDLEALTLGTVALKADVLEHGVDVEQLGVEVSLGGPTTELRDD
jgi:hypothetical protein